MDRAEISTVKSRMLEVPAPDGSPSSSLGHGKRLYRNAERLILASASPRREELLRSTGISLEILPSGIDESEALAESPAKMAERWACEKAMAVARLHPDHWVLGADTIVVLEGTVFGKPADPEEAFAMLQKLSGRAHEVMTGMCLVHIGKYRHRSATICTRVEFKDLLEAEIRSYVATGEPLDKAGAYGIQSMGGSLVRAVHGSYTNVVGLPLCEVIQWLLEEGVILPASE